MSTRRPRTATSFVLTLAIALSFATVADSAAQPEAPQEETELSRPTRFSAQVTARSTGNRVEVEELRTEDSTTYANPDGTLTDELYAAPIRVQTEEGLQDVDPTLVESDNAVVPVATAAELRFSDGGTGETTRVGDGDHFLGARLAGIVLPEPVLSGSVATYRNITPGTDLQVEARTLGLKEQIILRERPAEAPVYRFPLTLGDVQVTRNTDGRLTVTLPSGKVFAVSDTPLMWGAAIDPTTGEPTRMASVATSLVTEDGKPLLEVRPDPAFLADPEVTLPITIDPSTSLNFYNDTFVQKNYPTTEFWTDAHLREKI